MNDSINTRYSSLHKKHQLPNKMVEIKLKLSSRTMCFIACVELCNYFSGDATSEKCIKHWSNVMTLIEEMDVEHSKLFNEILEQFNDKKL